MNYRTLTKESKSQKVKDIVSRFVYGDETDQEATQRVRALEQSFHDALDKAQMADSRPVKLFLAEMRQNEAEIDYALLEKEEMDEIERASLFKTRAFIRSVIAFWEGAKKRAESLGASIDREWEITKD